MTDSQRHNSASDFGANGFRFLGCVYALSASLVLAGCGAKSEDDGEQFAQQLNQALEDGTANGADVTATAEQDQNANNASVNDGAANGETTGANDDTTANGEGNNGDNNTANNNTANSSGDNNGGSDTDSSNAAGNTSNNSDATSGNATSSTDDNSNANSADNNDGSGSDTAGNTTTADADTSDTNTAENTVDVDAGLTLDEILSKYFGEKLGSDGVYDLTFDDIKFEMEIGDEFKRELVGRKVESLGGKRIRIRGYMFPTFSEKLKNFTLVRDNMECCFGPGAALYDSLSIQMTSDNEATYTERPVTVEGTFSVDVVEFEDWGIVSIFRIDSYDAK